MKLGIQINQLRENKAHLWKAYVEKLNADLRDKQRRERKKKELFNFYYKTKKEDKKNGTR